MRAHRQTERRHVPSATDPVMLGDEENLPKRNTYLGCDDFCWVSSFFLGGLGSLKIQTNKRWVMLFGMGIKKNIMSIKKKYYEHQKKIIISIKKKLLPLYEKIQEKRKHEETKKRSSQDTKKRRNEAAKTRRNEETKKRRNEAAKTRRNEETKKRRNEAAKTRRNEETKKRSSQETKKRSSQDTKKRRNEDTKK